MSGSSFLKKYSIVVVPVFNIIWQKWSKKYVIYNNKNISIIKNDYDRMLLLINFLEKKEVWFLLISRKITKKKN